MANREQKGNREKRKPKADKQKAPTAQTTPFARVPGASNPKSNVGKKGPIVKVETTITRLNGTS